MGGAALAAFRSQCLAEQWDLTVCSLADLRQRLVDLFPNAESTLTRKLASMTFRAKSMMSDLVKFRYLAKHSTFGKMLDATTYIRSCAPK